MWLADDCLLVKNTENTKEKKKKSMTLELVVYYHSRQPLFWHLTTHPDAKAEVNSGLICVM